jgi:hypothetical protein
MTKETANPEKPTPTSSAKPAKAKPDASNDPWAKIAVGDIVLYHDSETGKNRGWWECTIIDVSIRRSLPALVGITLSRPPTFNAFIRR